MKLFFFAIIIALSSATGNCQLAEFSFITKTITLPDIKEGEVAEFEYAFKNIGKVPLFISDVKVQCSCTKIDFPEEPIAPGASGVIKVYFNSEGKYEFQDRTIILYANTKKKSLKLRFKVFVLSSK
jgi:hypothetical protein